eukprot:TRINITY_DN9137_c1_g1_i1.p1 TRINITY_DN9137_c1_g1~~TRINITY_DN9137_c1_g1_i1.p1  ORF type:complete len:1294 (+),score=214.62 TRINITY_DN9137_c1_g1_i1:70-3951(+)
MHAGRWYVLGALIAGGSADVYMHHPRGSNNKLNEQSNNVRTNTRLFNSQNNNNGGYQVGDACEPNCRMGGSNQNQYQPNRRGAADGQLVFYVGSVLTVEWTQQHGCGANSKSKCQIVLQYMCDDGVRDGYTTDKIPENEGAMDDRTFGMNEDYYYYEKCLRRQRNKGLYTADRKVSSSRGAEGTRQNNNPNSGNRRGFECQEERDYYPYWHPTPWRDIAVLTMDLDRCEYYETESENVKGRGECVGPDLSSLENSELPNNERACEREGYTWMERPPHTGKNGEPLPPPVCRKPPYGRDNHLGNAGNGFAATYNWTIPEDAANSVCVLRLRYNISTGDYLPNGEGGSWKGDWDVDSSMNGRQNAYIRNNPYADFIGYNLLKKEDMSVGDDVVHADAVLRLAVNTAQVGRTFQDRSHSFRVLPRPLGIAAGAAIHNLGVRGRRGNIVQVYPAVEYDFVPNHLVVAEGDYVHIQWQHSDANANNDGEGKQRTDRSNLVMTVAEGLHANTPRAYEQGLPLFAEQDGRPDHLRTAYFAHLGQEGCEYNTNVVSPNDQNNNRNCAILNRASATVNGGLAQMRSPGKHHIMSTRNNNFSNRSQKGIIEVISAWLMLPAAERGNGAAIGVVAGVVALTFAAAAAAMLRSYLRSHPHLPAAQHWLVRKLFSVPAAAGVVPPGTVSVSVRGLSATGFSAAAFASDVAEAAGCGAAVLSFCPAVGDVPADVRVHISDAAVSERTLMEALAAKHAVVAVQRLEPDSGLDGDPHRAAAYNARWVRVFFVAQLALWLWGFLKHRAVLERHGNFWLPIAKGCGTALNLVLVATVLPMLRNLCGFLRDTPLRAFVDFDSAAEMHKCGAYSVLAHAAVHTLAHAGNIEFFRVRFCPAPQCSEGCECLEGPWGRSWGGSLRTLAGWTGLVLLVLFGALFYGARAKTRRSAAKANSGCPFSATRLASAHGGWDFFWYTHHLWIPAYLLMLLHAPNFHAWVATPAVLLIVEKTIEYTRLVEDCRVVGATLVSRDVLHLRLVKHGLRWKSGQYVRLKIPSISPFVTHPFTISSAPEQEYLGVHIRANSNNDWTWELRQMLEGMPSISQRTSYPKDVDLSSAALKVALDGPYPAPTQEYTDYDTVVLVGAGIGITPFASIIKSLYLRKQRRGHEPYPEAAGRGVDPTPSNCYFYWMVNSESHFSWFSSLMNEIQGADDVDKVCEFQTYMTGDFDLEDYARRHRADQLPWRIQRTGKPDWRRVVSELKAKHDGTAAAPHRVGVFLCGPDGIAASLSRECRKAESSSITFTFLKERF